MLNFNRRIGKLVPLAIASALAIASFSATALPANADAITSSIARGGQFYDKWYKVIKAPKLEETHFS